MRRRSARDTTGGSRRRARRRRAGPDACRSVPSKISRDRKYVVSSGLPMMLPRSPRPRERAVLDDVLGAAGVHEDRRAELGRLRPERIVLRQRQVLVVVAADRGAAHAEPFHGVLELLRRRGRDTAAAPKPVPRSDRDSALTIFASPSFCAWTMRAARSRSVAHHQKPLMLRACMSMPVWSICAMRVGPMILVAAAAALLLERCALDDVLHGHDAVGVDVDHPDAPPADRDLAASAGGRLGQEVCRPGNPPRGSRPLRRPRPWS